MSGCAKHALIAGGTRGIGFGVAQALVDHGYRVTLVARNDTRLREAATALGASASWRRADVGCRVEVQAAIDGLGAVDVLVNAAGGFMRGVSLSSRSEHADANWDAVMDSNLKGSFIMAHAVAPLLTSPGGCIINISSISAQTGGARPGGLAYSAAKSGLHGLTYALAHELAPRGITANVIAPGFIAETAFTGSWPQERVLDTVAEIPLGRAGKASDIAGAVLWLASEAGSFVTGAVIPVNGGWRIG